MKIKKQKKNILHGIGAKTTFSHVTLAVLIIIFAAISMFAVLNIYIRNSITSELLAKATTISKLESGASEFVYDYDRAEFYEQTTASSVIFFDEQYSEIYSLSSGRTILFDYISMSVNWDVQEMLVFDGMDKYLLATILTGETVSDIRSIQYVRDDIVLAGAPIFDIDGNVVAGVILVQSIDVFQSQRKLILNTLLTISALAIPFAVYISLHLARRLTKPLIDISDGAQLLSEGNYSIRVAQQSTDEIGGIANSLNSLSGRLRRTIGNLRRERDMLDMIMNGINEGIIAVDWYMHTVHCNDSFLRMLEMNKRPESVDPTTEYGSILKKCMRSDGIEHIVWTDASGNKLRAVATKLHGEEGIVIGAVCLVNDVSETMRLEQMRRDYVANVSHELRTPLTGIRGMVEPLIDGVFETEEERLDCYNIIYKETIRLEKLIQEMLDMSRLQDGRMTLTLEPIELTQILHDAVGRIIPVAHDAGITINVENDASNDLIMCIGNEDRVLQVLTVFLDNALSFTSSGGSITIYARKENTNVRIGVKDTGCGIEPKDMPYIWERFYKVDKSRMRTKGTGLGLAIAKLVVELMHGEIGVNSVPNEGADFWFTLPAGDDTDNI